MQQLNTNTAMQQLNTTTVMHREHSNAEHDEHEHSDTTIAMIWQFLDY